MREQRELAATSHMELIQLVAIDNAADAMKGYWDELREQTTQAVRE